jgi:hypothetical protein
MFGKKNNDMEGVIYRIMDELFNLEDIEVELSSFQIYFDNIYDLYDNKVSLLDCLTLFRNWD